MEAHYKTLSTIYDIVKADPAPHTYLCSPREVILRHTEDWTSIQAHLDILVAEKLIVVKQLDKIVICITLEGIAKAKSLKNNFVSTHFSFGEDKSVTQPQSPLY
jgi:hypothetical protein